MVAHSDLTAFDVGEAQPVLKYHAEIHEIGPMVYEFLPHGMLIFFGETAPKELREVAIVHDGTQLLAELKAGDFLKFTPPADDQSPTWYRLTAVGGMANANLAELGHVVVHFDGASTAGLPGAISVEPSLVALPALGATFEFFELREKHYGSANRT